MRAETDNAVLYAELRRQGGDCGWFNPENLDEFFEHHGMKEVDNWINKVYRSKWDYNFLKYIRQAFKQDWLDFIRVKKNQNDERLYRLQNPFSYEYMVSEMYKRGDI
jgi:hypothetical protein